MHTSQLPGFGGQQGGWGGFGGVGGRGLVKKTMHPLEPAGQLHGSELSLENLRSLLPKTVSGAIGRTQGCFWKIAVDNNMHQVYRTSAASVMAGDQLWATPDLELKRSMSGCIFVCAQLSSCFRSCLLSLSHPLPQLMHLLIACSSLQSANKSTCIHYYHATSTPAVTQHKEVTLRV